MTRPAGGQTIVQGISRDAIEQVMDEQPDAGEVIDGVVEFADGSRLVALPADPVLRLQWLRVTLRLCHREAVDQLETERNGMPEGNPKDEFCRLIDSLAAAHADLDDAVHKVGSRHGGPDGD